jgi:hypothetical protein
LKTGIKFEKSSKNLSGIQLENEGEQVYSLVSYLFIKQDQMILTCNSAVASLMLSIYQCYVPSINLLALLVHKKKIFKY